MRHQMRTYARQWLHAVAKAGHSWANNSLELLMGPNGAVMWTETTRIHQDQPYSDDLVPVVTGLAAPMTSQTTVDMPRPEPVGSTVEVPAV
jgi:hypothetical protein